MTSIEIQAGTSMSILPEDDLQHYGELDNSHP